jgi:hypothetical protein
MMRELFTAQMRRMNGLRFPPADLSTHWAGLGDLPIDVLTRAVERSIRTRSDFPTPAEVRQDADLSQPTLTPPAEEPEDTRLPAPIQVSVAASHLSQEHTIVITHAHTYHCETCSDTGWETHWCGGTPQHPWVGLYRCARGGTHADHEWTTACACTATNPALVRRRERAAVKYAEEPPKRWR